MKEISIEKMEVVSGGMSCGAAVGIALLTASAIGATALLAPAFWASPKTWYTAAGLIGANVANYKNSCLK